MTPEQAMEAFRDVVVVNSDRIVLELSHEFRKRPVDQQRKHFGGHYEIGFTWLIRSDAQHTDKVMETVVSAQGDAITSLYVNHRIFATLGTLMQAREVLINAIAERIGLSAGAVGVEDAGRGRRLGLTELSTGQLIDILAERTGSSIVVPNNRGGDVVALP